MQEELEEYSSQKLSSREGQRYLEFRRKNGQKADDLYKKVRDEIAECHLSVTEAKGFLDFMKLVVEESSYIPIKK
nr:MAG TPA: arginine decarboxylase [Caudoviricetes sp.]DAM59187.1 MAG TPA: arginine decarboxylase [Caudoviricetes sp.]